MNIKEIKELIEIVEASSLSEFSLKEGNLEINMKKSVTVPEAGAPALREISRPAVQEEEPEEDTYIMSPMVGTFYSSPAPDAVSYVNVGDTVKKGQTLCIIEAMKLMNEIKAEQAGKVVQICVKNGDPIEFGQVLMYVE